MFQLSFFSDFVIIFSTSKQIISKSWMLQFVRRDTKIYRKTAQNFKWKIVNIIYSLWNSIYLWEVSETIRFQCVFAILLWQNIKCTLLGAIHLPHHSNICSIQHFMTVIKHIYDRIKLTMQWTEMGTWNDLHCSKWHILVGSCTYCQLVNPNFFMKYRQRKPNENLRRS